MHTPPAPAAAPSAADLDAIARGLHAARHEHNGAPLWTWLVAQLQPPHTAQAAGTAPEPQALADIRGALQPPPDGLDAQGLLRLVRVARLSAAPATSLAHLFALGALVPTPIWQWPAAGRLALASALGGSPAAARLLLGEPTVAEQLFAFEDIEAMQSPQLLRDRLRQARAASTDAPGFEARLRRRRSQAWVRIVARALSGLCDVDTTLRELSDLADAVVDAITRYHLRRERTAQGPFVSPQQGTCGFAVVAQGKLGGRELNLSSDIDLQFIYAPPAEVDRATSELHARLSAVAQRLVRGLSHNDAWGQGYRVDLDLRPEGKKGALVYTIGAMETYYATWGAAWERLALIRARHIAGAAWVSRALLRDVQTFVYPRHVAPDTVSQVRQVAVRIAQERRGAALAQGRAPGIDIKRDRGGIRDVELFVQTQQHLHGGKFKGLQTPSLFAALSALELLGVFSSETTHSLRQAYRFLRAVENCLQATEQRQTHRLPETEAGMAHLAGQMRLRLGGPGLERQIAKHRRCIHRLTQRLFVIPSAGKPTRTQRVRQTLSQGGVAQQAALEALGFKDGAWAQSLLEVLAQGRDGPFCRDAQAQMPELGALLVADMGRSPDPDQALRLYTDLDPLLRRAPGYLTLLAQSPSLRHRLIDLLGTSEFLSRTLVQFPDLVDWLAQTPDLTAQRLPHNAAAYAERLAARQQLFAGDVQAQLGAVCRFKLREQLRLGLLDKAGVLPTAQLCASLSALAEACVAATLRLSAQSLAPVPASTQPDFAIIAMGRLGSMEMGYGSDVDLVFVWRAPPDATGEAHYRHAAYALRLAQGCIARLTARNLEGALYAIDTRLRPSGNQGPLVTHADSFIAYYAERAMLWECQALLRARPVAGDMALGAQVLAACAPKRYPSALPQDALGEIHRMRLRMGQARPTPQRPKPAQQAIHADIKVGQGGLSDLEFAVQTLQLQHAHAHPSLQLGHTAHALEALGALGLVSAQRAQRSLETYWYLRRLEGALRIVHDRALSTLDLSQPGAKALARRMGYGHLSHPIKALARDWQRHAKRAQALYAHVFRDVLKAAP